MNNIIKTNYFDSKGKEYKLDDIVFNPYMQDYWIVKQYTKEEIEKYETDCSYYLALWGDKDYHFEDLNTPDSFEIICSKGDPQYFKLLSDIQDHLFKLKKAHKEEQQKAQEYNKQLELTKLTNRELIEKALDQIEEETGFHITDKKFGNCYFIFEDEDDSICHFHIKEIPGFLFAFWNTCRFDKIEDQIKNHTQLWSDYYSINSKSELVFFTQYERDIDKFKPSYSGFVTGIFRQVWFEKANEEPEEHRIEEFYMNDLIDILTFMKKHPIKAYYFSGTHSNNIWDSLPNYRYLWIFLKDTFYNLKYKLKRKIEYKLQIERSFQFVKKLKCLNAVILDRGSCWTPRIEIFLRQPIDFSMEDYKKDSELFDRFEEKYWNDISLTYCGIDLLADNITEKDLEEDKKHKQWFYENAARMNELNYFDDEKTEADSEDEIPKVLYYNVKKEDI